MVSTIFPTFVFRFTTRTEQIRWLNLRVQIAIIGWFGKETGKSLDDGTRSTNQTNYGQISTESRLFRAPFQRHLPFPLLLLWLFYNQFENKEINENKKKNKRQKKKHTTYDGRSSGALVNNCLINVAREEEYCDGTSWEEHSTD